MLCYVMLCYVTILQVWVIWYKSSEMHTEQISQREDRTQQKAQKRERVQWLLTDGSSLCGVQISFECVVHSINIQKRKCLDVIILYHSL